MPDSTLTYQTPSPPSRFIPGFRWVILALLFLAITINYIDRLVVSLVFDKQFKLDHGIDPLHFGYIVSWFAIAYAIGQIFSGWLLDKLGTRVVFSLSLFAWSICAMLTGLGGGWLSFAIFRAMLGVAESPSYPGAAKICAEWFPQRQRSFAFGWVNAGANMAVIITPLLVPWLVVNYGWQSAFFWTGAMGLVLLLIWVPLYRRPEKHPFVGPKELAIIQSDPPEPTVKVPWRALLRYPQAWVFMSGKVMTDGIWWFLISWLPTFLYDNYKLDIKNIGWPLVTIYLFADLGSIGGGMFSSLLIRRGATVNRARKTAMLVAALCALPIVSAPFVHNLWGVVFIVGLAVAGHQAFSSNLYTLTSDMFPKRLVASVAGLGGFCGYMGASAFNSFVGFWNQKTGNFYVPFLIAAVTYVLTLAVMHWISPNFRPALVDESRGFPVEPEPAGTVK